MRYQKFTCKICGEVITTCRGTFKKHIELVHNLNFEDYLREYHPELGGYCSICGKPTNFMDFTNGFYQYCSTKCSRNSTEVKEKQKQTNLERYGVENPSQSNKIKEKKKQTTMKHYGVYSPLQNKEIQKKAKKTTMERYGVEWSLQSKEIQEKSKQTNLKRYGVNYPAQSPEIQEKMKQTMLEKYGVENPSQFPEIQEKVKQTNLERYGVENPLQSLEIREKMKYSSIPYRFSLHEVVCKRLDIVILETPEEWYHKEWDLNIHTHRFHCNIHNLDFESEWFKDRNLCPECKKALWSKGEREVGDYIESLEIPIIRNDRNMIKPKEIDIWIPSKNIGIEYNGSYWHQDMEKDLEKVALCESKGINLIFIWDTQWENNKEKVKEYLRKILF